jgi:hypothetical protein
MAKLQLVRQFLNICFSISFSDAALTMKQGSHNILLSEAYFKLEVTDNKNSLNKVSFSQSFKVGWKLSQAKVVFSDKQAKIQLDGKQTRCFLSGSTV